MSDASYVLVTGVNGSGKTLLTVADLADQVKAWEAHPEDRRTLYVHGIRDLQLEHVPLPIYPAKGKPGDEYRRTTLGQPAEAVCVDWASVEQGSLVVIDEAQKLFPSRSVGTPVPEHVRWFEDGRQLGVTVILITQTPTSIDTEIRKRCGLHRHYQRKLGVRSVLEWEHVQTSCSGGEPRMTVVRSRKDAYGLYSSALVHGEKISGRFPLWLLVPIAGIVLAVVAAPSLFSSMRGVMGGRGSPVASSASSPAGGVPGVPAGPAVPGLAGGPPVPGQPASDAPPPPLGCMSMGSRCVCIDQSGRAVPSTPAVCRESAREYTALMPYPVRHDPPAAALPVEFGASGAAARGAARVDLLAGLK